MVSVHSRVPSFSDLAVPGYSSLPLAGNSSFIEAALEVGMIGTRQWSVWTGNPDLGIDGLFVLGGYDEARVAGDFTSFDVDEETQLPYLQVKGMSWEGSDGRPVELMPNSTSYLWALPEPFTELIHVPQDTYDKFVAAVNSTGTAMYNSTSEVTQYSNVPNGELVITLNNGMKTTIPVQDLFFHPQSYNDDGILKDKNDTYYWDALQPLSNPSGAIYLGLPFMNQKMFVADWDGGKFYMADAAKDEQTSTNIRPLCTSTTTAPPPPPSPAADSGPNVAAIGGGVGGGVGGLLVIALIAWFVLKKKKAQKQAIPEVEKSPFQASGPPPQYATAGAYPGSEQQEKYYSQPPQQMPQEMASPPPPMASRVVSYMPNSASSEAASSDYWVGQPAGSVNHGDKGFTAVSGPVEMPAAYDERFATNK